jgi:hypothetical protein
MKVGYLEIYRTIKNDLDYETVTDTNMKGL